ncbi:oligosaccharide flippase family protein [Glaciecola siphonariae]|uniref:Oligosaccharide flippase family protein n=1 Tax=Glaciecola siphonariae TaxID=521012 RepID=A0ABV9LZG8_9ALTE
MSDAKRGLVRNIFSVFSTRIFVLSIGLISAVLIARGLGAEGRGIYAALLVYPALLVTLTEGGMRQAAIFYIGKKKASDAEIIGTLLSYTILAGSIGYLMVYWLQRTFGPDAFTNIMMLAAAAILPATLAVNAIKGVFLGKERIKQFNKAHWVQKILFVAAIALLYVSNTLTVSTVMFATVGAAIFNLVQALYFLKKHETLSFTFSAKTFFPMFRLGVVYALAFFFITANYRIDLLIMSWMAEPDEVGRYAIAVQLGELLWQLPGAVLLVIMSKTANSIDNSIVLTVAKTTRLTLLITAFSALPFAFACYFLIGPVFGEEFASSFFIILYLLPGLVLAAVFKTINSYFSGQGQPLVTVYLMGTIACLNIILNILLIPVYGGTGAAISTTISYAIAALGCCILMSYREGVSVRSLIIPYTSDFKIGNKKKS